MNNLSNKSRAWSQTVQGKGARIGLMSILLVSLGTLAGCGSEPNTEQADAQPAEVQPVEETEVTPEVVEAEESEVVETEEMPAETEVEEADTAAEPEEAEQATAANTETEELSANAGQELYEAKCKQCHEPGLLNAPKFGDTEAWAERIAKGKDTLHKHSAEGYKSMPAQADDTATVAEVHAAVDYMIEHSS